jgi:two-component system, NtrC family, response regulator GlrR
MDHEKTVVVIVDAEPGQPIGRELQVTIEGQGGYDVELARDFAGNQNTLPRLIIPILPVRREPALKMLEELTCSGAAEITLLPVVRAETLSRLRDTIDVSEHDFLVAPLREAEVLARIDKSVRPWCCRRVTLFQACGLAQLVGEDKAFAALKRNLQSAAQFGSNVLLTGETGTGKERCAHALHYLSNRADKPFLPVNCGAIPVELFESELYGHQRGAFTGALASSAGLIAEADGGTLFLDEVETLNMMSQVKLLRFLQDQTYYSVGSAKSKQANVWIIASSNVDLLGEAKRGAFREDLYYRLAVVKLMLPPLRDRISDIAPLARHFLKRYGDRHSRPKVQFSVHAMQVLAQHSWPGNVRELENLVQQVLALTRGDIIEAENLPIPQGEIPLSSGATFKQRKAEAISSFEKTYIEELLRIHDGNITRAGVASGKERRALGRMIKKYSLKNVDKQSA